MKNKLLVITAILSFILTGLSSITAAAADVPRMSKEELKAKLGSPDVIILDVRTLGDWYPSDYKIKGAIRESKREFSSWANKYPRDKTLVLYCA